MITNYNNLCDKRSYSERWPLVSGKRLFKVVDERSSDGTEELLSVSHITGITPRSQKNVTMFKSESLVGYKKCAVGDIAANTMWTWQGAIGVSQYEGVISPAYNVYRQRSNNYNPRYLDMLLREKHLVDVYHSISTGIRPSRLRLYPEPFMTITLPVPPREEQDQIVRYLDWQVSKVNKLIAAKKKEIEFVKEIRDTQFAACEGTKRVKLKHIVELLENFLIIDSEQHYQKTGMYNRGRGIFQRQAVNGSEMGDSKFQRIIDNCILISGQFAWEGAAYITAEKDTKAVVSHRYYLLKPCGAPMPIEYIWAFLMSKRGLMEMDRCSHGAAGRNKPLNIREFLNVEIPIPKKDSEIVTLQKTVRALMTLNCYLAGQHDILNELKSRIVSDVVTGQIDVRNMEIPDFEMVEETDTYESLDEDNAAEEDEEQEEE